MAIFCKYCENRLIWTALPEVFFSSDYLQRQLIALHWAPLRIGWWSSYWGTTDVFLRFLLDWWRKRIVDKSIFTKYMLQMFKIPQIT